MEYLDLELTKIHITNKKSRDYKMVQAFLEKEQLELDSSVEFTVAILLNEKVIGTGSFDKNILKSIAINEEYRGMGLTNEIVSELINEQYRRGYNHIFVYTKVKNEKIFKNLGFYEIERATDKVILLENNSNGIKNYCEKLKEETKGKVGEEIASVVVNCNPFTLGHRYLIEKASKENDLVHLFVLWEDKSIFPAKVRLELVEEGLKDLKNVIIHKAEDYIISNATFPTYFIKDKDEAFKSYGLLDAKIFSRYIAKELNITKRYVGTEPSCIVTNRYNTILKNILSINNIELREIERLKIDGEFVSASTVRKLIKEDNFQQIKKLVPKTTFDYLISEDAVEIINKIKRTKD
ncbi:MAG: [citrate (pro-3S)-lyase] ligase [Sarcina sp.]